MLAQLDAAVVGGVEDGNAAGVGPSVPATEPVRVRCVALVEDHDADGASSGGVLGLHLEEARAALEQCDVARREPGEVGGLAAAGGGVAEPELEVDCA